MSNGISSLMTDVKIQTADDFDIPAFNERNVSLYSRECIFIDRMRWNSVGWSPSKGWGQRAELRKMVARSSLIRQRRFRLRVAWVSEWVKEGGREWVGEWVGEWVSEWGSEWVSEWVREWVSEWVSEGVSEWVREGGSEWVREWVSEWVGEWVSEWVSEYYPDYLLIQHNVPGQIVLTITISRISWNWSC